jgi:glycosyltransferase involved in cell wall biosynthesis
MFGGMYSIGYSGKTFSRVYAINWPNLAKFRIAFYWLFVRKQVQQVIKQSKPDIVHAHDIFSAKMISEFGLPFVYDDHEYWPVYVRGLFESSMSDRDLSRNHIWSRVEMKARKAAWNLILRHKALALWTNWERELVSSAPTIVTTGKAAKELRESNSTNRVFVMPNFPTMFEVKDFEKPIFHNSFSSVYAGIIQKGGMNLSHKIMDGLEELFDNHNIGKLTMIGAFGQPSAKVHFTGFLSRQSMYDEMFKHSVGLIPFKKYWSHQYISPNKAYEYAHAGLFVVCTSSLKTVIEDFKGDCGTFEDYNDLRAQLEYFKDNLDELYLKRVKTFEFARNNFIWENYENNIFDAYKLC